MEPRDQALSEAISFKLFDGQSLQYGDRIPDGFYDIWGNFVGVADNTPVSNFPTLEELLRIPYIVGEEREVILVDRSNDARLRELEAQASAIMKINERASPLTCVKELAVFVADCLGGACSHETLSQQYQVVSRKLKQELNSLVLPLGELPLGLSRHRALMLKVLADNCGLPCRLVRGDFYLGSAGHSGENSIALLQFDGQEWMLELVTEPGKLHRVRNDPVREQQAARWNARNTTSSERHATLLHRQGFPTLPGAEKETRENSSSSDPSSGAQKEGLQWSDLDGPTMEDLESEAQSHPSNSSTKEPSTASQTKARADEQLQGLTQRLNVQRSNNLSPDLSAELSKQTTAESLEASQLSFAEEQQDKDSTDSQEKWLPYDGVQQGLPLSMAGIEEVRTAKFGSSHGTGPARARVRGRDARGRLVELELQGLTVTHAHNLALGNRSLDSLKQLPEARHSEDHANRSLESMIGRYRFLPTGRQSQSRTSGSSEEGRPQERSSLPAIGTASEMRQFLRGKLPALSDSEQKRGEAWERQMRERYSTDTRSSGSGQLSGERSPVPSAYRRAPDWASEERVAEPSAIDPDVARMRLHNLLHNSTIARQLSGDQRVAITTALVDTQGAAITKAPPAVVQQQTSQEAKGDQGAAAAAFVPTDPSLSEATTSTVDDDILAVEAADDVEVPFEEIELGPRIGVGCFGEVFKARWRQTTVAVKRLFAQTLSETNIKEFKAEVLMNRRLKHPNVIMFMGACTKPPNLSIITQWAPKGSLYHLLHNTGRPELTLRQRLRMALDIARGMHYLHSARPPVIHRDLKSMNLLVDNDLSIKVCDFGLARIRRSTWMTGTSQGGTPEWTAPEVLRNVQYNEKSDVYSYGVVLFELATGEEPWSDMHSMQVVGAVGWAGKRLEPPEGCPSIFADLMQQCFQEADRRPSFEKIIGELLRFANETRPQSAER